MSNPLAPLLGIQEAHLEPFKSGSFNVNVCLSECVSKSFTTPEDNTAAKEVDVEGVLGEVVKERGEDTDVSDGIKSRI